MFRPCLHLPSKTVFKPFKNVLCTVAVKSSAEKTLAPISSVNKSLLFRRDWVSDPIHCVDVIINWRLNVDVDVHATQTHSVNKALQIVHAAAHVNVVWTIRTLYGARYRTSCSFSCLIPKSQFTRIDTWVVNWSRLHTLGFIYIRAKGNEKATSLPICCIVSYLCIYTTATAVAANIKEKIAFTFAFALI